VGAVPAMDEVGTDETGSTGDEDGFRHQASFRRSGMVITSARASFQ
jgi:hypothetical protein